MLHHYRRKLRQVMQRASLVDISDLIETDLVRGVGRRESAARTYTGLGKMESVVEYTDDYPYSAINWGLSAQTYPRKRLIIKRTHLIKTDWFIIVDCSRTMDFGTEPDFKRTFASVLAASFAQAATKKRDRVAQVVYDEKVTGQVLEDASAEEMVLMALAYEQGAVRPGVRARRRQAAGESGLSLALAQTPDNRAIVPVVSDFLLLIDKDGKGRLTPAALHAREALRRAARFHNVLCCVVEDPRERDFPDAAAQLTLEDMRTGRRRTMTFAEAGRLMGEQRDERIAELRAFFRQIRVNFEVFASDDSARQLRGKMARLLSRGA